MTRSSLDLSVIIPARDVATTLPEQLDALLGQEWNGTWEIVVVDNGSTDATRDIACEYASRSRVRLVSAEPPGLSVARNFGIRSARSDAIAICDGDDVVGPRWVSAMGDALRQGADVVTGPLDLNRLNPPWLANTRGDARRDGPVTFHGTFPMIPGGNVGLQRAVWSSIGGFDETVVGMEDAEFSLRLWLAGVDVRWICDALVHYRYRGVAADLWRQGRQYGACRPLLCRRIAEAGRRPPSRIAGWRSWMWLLINVPRLATRQGRAAWLWVAGNRYGQLEGVIRHRALYL
jgi:glycosyltransferase involved in cell wall biosynthesis